jgi:Flp pilus assembly pilin Flp
MGNLLDIIQADYIRAVLDSRVARFQAARQQRDAGASAIELAIITAVIVAAAVVVLVAVKGIITTQTTNIKNTTIP